MGFILLPLAILLFLVGANVQFGQMAQTMPGAGIVGQMQQRASVASGQIEVFAGVCESTAIAASGVVSNALALVLPPGMNAPSNAVCMTTAGAPGRNIYAYMPGVAWERSRIMTDSGFNTAWYVVQSGGQAVNMAGGSNVSVPAAIPVGAVVHVTAANP